MPHRFSFNLLTFVIEDGRNQTLWHFGLFEIEWNGHEGHLFYIQDYYGFQMEVLYCRALCKILHRWFNGFARKK